MNQSPLKLKHLVRAMALCSVVAVVGCNSNDEPQQGNQGSHVASPEWQDQVIYFLMTDRFNEGDSSINDQGHNEYDPTSDKKFSGGDLQGIIDQLSYVQNLGATSIWITPPVANQWWDNEQNYGGYHGYWARDFQKIDEHFGSLETYQELARELHTRGMFLIQDIVTNHVGNYFTYDEPWNYDPSQPCVGFRLIDNPLAPGQALPYPLNKLECRDDGTGSYHWTPAIMDHNDPVQEKTWQLSDLDDLNTSDPEVRQYLKDSYRYWIREVGVDGFRVDTVKFVEHDFWNDFFHAEDGIQAQARDTGRLGFLAFGEVFETSTPYNTEGEDKMIEYIDQSGTPQLTTALNFPLQATMTRVFAGGQPTDYLKFRLEAMMDKFDNPFVMPNFIDNHDMPRFLSQGSEADMQQALVTLMTIPGIPVIYQGAEQGFDKYRDAMFAGGYREDGEHVDSFKQNSPWYQFVQELIELRTTNPVMTRGELEVLASDKAGAGILVLQRAYEGEEALVVMNTSTEPMLLNQLALQDPAGTIYQRRFDANWADVPDEFVVDSEGEISAVLPGKAVAIYFKAGQGGDYDMPNNPITIDGDWEGAVITGDTNISGTAPANSELQLVVDGNMTYAETVTADGSGAWSVTLSTRHFAIGEQQHRFAVYQAASGESTPDVNFISDLSWADTADQSLDDSGDAQEGSAGPSMDYSAPSDPSFDKVNSQLSIEQAEIFQVGSNLRLKLTMGSVTDTWLPPNGFDHVGFTIFFSLPGEDGGLIELPKLDASMPSGEWHRNAVVFGWQSSVYGTEGADTQTWGNAITPAPVSSVDKANNAIYLDFASEALGRPDSLDGIQIYVTSWDLDGLSAVYRPLNEQAGPWNFSSPSNAGGAKIWDELPIITLSE